MKKKRTIERTDMDNRKKLIFSILENVVQMNPYDISKEVMGYGKKKKCYEKNNYLRVLRTLKKMEDEGKIYVREERIATNGMKIKFFGVVKI